MADLPGTSPSPSPFPLTLDGWIAGLWQNFLAQLFGGPERGSRGAWIALLTACFLAGAAHWILFFNAGRLPYATGDWPKEISYLRVWQQALAEDRLPLYVDYQYQGTDCFLAIPETPLSPQLLLLNWVEPGRYVLGNVLLFYTVGFVGCVLLRRRLGLSLFAFSALFVLFNFNGCVTAHLAAGHSMWVAYFLLPFFVLSLLRAGEGKPTGRQAVGVSLILSAILFQGAFHLWIWCLLFLLVLGIFSRAHRGFCLGAILLAGVMGALRIAPAVICVPPQSPRFYSGYPTLVDFVAGFVALRPISYPALGGAVHVLGWWEYDVYVGLAGFAFLLYFGVGNLVRGDASPSHRLLRAPIAALTIFSITDLWCLVAMLPLPFASVERVSARFIMLPLVFVLVLACERASRLLAGAGARLKAAALVFLGLTLMELWQHSVIWALARIEKQLELAHFTVLLPSVEQMNVHLTTGQHSSYESMLSIGGLISAVTILGALTWWIVETVKARPSTPAV